MNLNSGRKLKIAIIAGEPSGDVLAADLMLRLKNYTSIPIEFIGIGGDSMKKMGLWSLYDMGTLSVGGFGLDVLFAIPKIFCLYRKITKAIIKYKPDAFIGVDAPDFNFHVEKKLKNNGIKTIHYISPSIWAWRYKRIYKIKKSTDYMLCIFPMEEEIYKKESIAAKFIGNPIANRIEMDIDIKKYRKLSQIEEYSNVFTVLVGSRKAEIRRLAPIFIRACSIIADKLSVKSIFVFPFTSDKLKELFNNILLQFKPSFNYKLVVNDTVNVIKAADLVIAKSGTVTLEVALCKKPMVISYIVAPLTEFIVRKTITVKYVGQPNIFLGEEVVKELLQKEATAENIAKEIISLYYNKDRQEYIVKRFYELHKMLKSEFQENSINSVFDFMLN